MIKAKEFWQVLCEDLNYRFFSGVACGGFNSLFKSMSPEFMHYIPAANEKIALGLASGASVAGFKSAILISDRMFTDIIYTVNDLNFKYKIPLLIIAFSETNQEFPLKMPKINISEYNLDEFKNYISNIDLRSQKICKPGLVTIEEGVLR